MEVIRIFKQVRKEICSICQEEHTGEMEFIVLDINEQATTIKICENCFETKKIEAKFDPLNYGDPEISYQ